MSDEYSDTESSTADTEMIDDHATDSSDTDQSPVDGELVEDEVSDSPSDVVDPVEPFVRYVNSLYRVMTMAGSGLILVLGIGAGLVSRMVSPPLPIAWTLIDVVVTTVLFLWYVLGMRMCLDVYEDRVVVATKLVSKMIMRTDIESIAIDSSWWGVVQPSGRVLVIAKTDGKSVRAFGALPSDAVGQGEVVASLQAQLGNPDDVASARVEERLRERFESKSDDAESGAGSDGTTESDVESEPKQPRGRRRRSS